MFVFLVLLSWFEVSSTFDEFSPKTGFPILFFLFSFSPASNNLEIKHLMERIYISKQKNITLKDVVNEQP